MYVKKNRSSAPQQTKYNFNIKYQDKTYILVILMITHKFSATKATSKKVGLYSPLPFPYICKNE